MKKQLFSRPLCIDNLSQHAVLNKLAFLVLLLWFNIQYVSAQDTIIRQSGCTNFNEYAVPENNIHLTSLVAKQLPNGILFLNPDKMDSLPQLLLSMGVSPNSSFEPIRTIRSRFDEAKIYTRFQQLYNGIEVEGGGYTISFINTTGSPFPTTNIPTDPHEPCTDAYMMYTQILTGISLNTIPNINEVDLPTIIGATVNTAKLVISHNLINQCDYLLCWKVNYFDQVNKTAWINAISGDTVRTIESDCNLDLPGKTINYGIPVLTNTFTNPAINTTYLASSDHRITVYTNCPPLDEDFDFENNNNIPNTTSNIKWPGTSFIEQHQNQTYYVATKVVPKYDDLNINFQDIRLGNCISYVGAYSKYNSTTNQTRLVFGAINPGGTVYHSYSLNDVMAHELGHTYLNHFLTYESNSNASLHEGLSDAMGTYIESKIQGYVDWTMGDDDGYVATSVDRNLKTPYSYLDNYLKVKSFTWSNRHKRCVPLGHWFYLVSDGDTPSFLGIGIDKALKIVLESLNLIGSGADYPDLMEATLSVVQEEYGRCSPEFFTVAKAWEKIQVTTGFAVNGVIPDCQYWLSSNSPIWEETDNTNISFMPVNAINYGDFYWTMIGRQSPYYQALGLQTGNTVTTTGPFLKILDFPKHPYYPQFLTIQVRHNTLGLKSYVKTKIKIEDRDGDDPTCEDYYNQFIAFQNLNAKSNEQTKTYKNIDKQIIINKITKVRVYNLLGQLILSSNYEGFNNQQIPFNGWLVFHYLDENNNILTKETKIVTH